MRTESRIEIPDGSSGKAAVLSVKMREAMAKVVAAARARSAARRAAGPATARGRLKAALSPARWRAGAGRWLPAGIRAGGMVVIQESVPAQTSEAEAALAAEVLVRLAPATSRAALYGKPVTIRLDDERLADVFRAALARTAVDRPTDRLVQIVVTDA